MSNAAPESSGIKILASNRKAFHDYHILEKFEAGVELRGAEVKSIRAGLVSLQEGYADVENGQVFIHGMRIQPYSHSRQDQQEPDRPKRLLLHRSEIHQLVGKTAIKGHTLIPLKLYLRRGRVKLELGLGRGKLFDDKRETLKRRTAEREAQRAIASRRRAR
jgi:SsrA-binding protein